MKVRSFTEFRTLIIEILKTKTISEVSTLCKTSISTVKRWINNETRPNDVIMTGLFKILDSELSKEKTE